MNSFKSTDLLAVLIALIELQIFAVEAKRKCARSAALKYLGAGASSSKGICYNVYETPSRLPGERDTACILSNVIRNAPSNTSSCFAFPVNSPFPEKSRSEIYKESTPFTMWGDHPYADNRRQLIAEMIWQVRVELKARGYKL